MKRWFPFAVLLACALVCAGLLIRHFETKIPVLLYHSILPAEVNEDLDNLSIITPEVFESHMAYLHDAGFETITTEELSAFVDENKKLPGKRVMITFDDGYLDNYVYAYDILKKYGFTAVDFLIGRTVTEEPQAFEPMLFPRFSHAEIGQSADVFEFGSHTFDMHSREDDGTPFLFLKTKEEIAADFEKSFSIPGTKRILAYPFGKYDRQTVEVLEELHCPLGFTVNHGYVTWRTGSYDIPRYSIHSTMSMEDFKKIVDVVR